MEEYYSQFYGPVRKIEPLEDLKPPAVKKGDEEKVRKDSFLHLTEAAKLVEGLPEHQRRVDHLRMYYHYNFVLRKKLEDAAKAQDEPRIIEAVKEETIFAARLMNTNMLFLSLLTEGFNMRFGKYRNILSKVPEAQADFWDIAHKKATGWRGPREDVPTHEEMKKLWSEDKAYLGY